MKEQDRVVEVWNAARDALQKVVRDLRINEAELKIAGQYFNRLGQSGMFPSLLAVGLAMTSVDATRSRPGGTRQNLEGPFHRAGAPKREGGRLFEQEPDAAATKLHLGGRVLDAATGAPIEGAVLDFWQADQEGVYDHSGFELRGVVSSGADGSYEIETIVPRDYAEHDNDPIGELFRAMGRHNRRAAHIHLKADRAGYIGLVTQIFMPNSSHLQDDYVEGAVSEDLTLKFEPVPGDEGRAVKSRFNIRLARDE